VSAKVLVAGDGKLARLVGEGSEDDRGRARAGRRAGKSSLLIKGGFAGAFVVNNGMMRRGLKEPGERGERDLGKLWV
jgi:hypothetical protein